jgi:hypothetical protein
MVITKQCPRALPVVLAALALAACSEGPFNEYSATIKLQAKPIQLDGEQVVITPEQVTCGEKDELWIVLPQGNNRAIGRLNDSARALGFSDDIHIGDPGFRNPYAQIRGEFPVSVTEVRMRDLDATTKQIEAKTSVVIDHSCFKNPKPLLMGLRLGQFSETDNPAYHFRLHGETWDFEQLVH